MKNRPSKESLDEIPEVDFEKAKIVRRGPRPGRTQAPLSLRQIREGTGKTQMQVAALLDTEQSEVSRLERREDAALSTLRKYAEALGAKCEVVFTFPHGQRYTVALGVEPETK